MGQTLCVDMDENTMQQPMEDIADMSRVDVGLAALRHAGNQKHRRHYGRQRKDQDLSELWQPF